MMMSDAWVHLSTTNADIPLPGPATEQTACLTLDIDQNGVKDFVIGSRNKEPAILWYQRIGTGWVKRVIESKSIPIEAGGAFEDIDKDGDLDIVFGTDYQDSKVYWWENPYPEYSLNESWKRHGIKKSGLNQHHDQMFGDFDGDGKPELVFWNQGSNGKICRLFIAKIPPNPNKVLAWPYKEIFSSPIKCEGLAKADIDQDGITDIVGGGRLFKKVNCEDFSSEVIDLEQSSSRVAVGQLKKGGRPEVVFVVGDGIGRLKWYEWIKSSWVAHDLLGFDVDHGHSLQVADIDGDGNLDIFCGEMRLKGHNDDAKIWIFYGDGHGNFNKKEIAEGFGVHEAKLSDLDGDGDLDILGKPYDWETPRIDIWLNNGTNTNLSNLDCWRRHVIDRNRPWRAIFASSADIDKDGLKDIVTGGWWYKNPRHLDRKWKRNAFGSPLNNMVLVNDFDSDGDIDVLGTQGKGAHANDSFVWGRNNGSGNFSIFKNIMNGDGDFLQGAAIAQFQKADGLGIALSWHETGKGIQMLTVPPNPADKMWVLNKITEISQDECLSAGDIDRDSDIDLLLGTKWFRNDGRTWEEFNLAKSTEAPDRNRIADINSDGRMDAVVGYEAISSIGKLAWYEQGDTATSKWKEHLIANIVGPMSLDVVDMDQDGDLDVIAGEHNLKNPSSASLYIFENIDLKGLRWRKHIVFIGDEHHDGARVTDIDGDGDYDIISIGWGHPKVLLYENRAINSTDSKTMSKTHS